jgi:integrase
MAKRAKGGQSTNLPKLPGRYRMAPGLYLIVRSATSGSYFYRYTVEVDGRTVRREMGLGVAFGRDAVSLDDARIAAIEAGKLVKAGGDPVKDKKAKRVAVIVAKRQDAVAAVTFWEVAESFIEQQQKNDQWEQSLRDHAKPLHHLSVGAITTEDVLSVLRPLWLTKTETASRLRSRIAAILDSAKVDGLRDGENPARWDGHLALKLPQPGKVKRVRHHSALPWRDVPGLLADLTETDGMGAKALAFTVLTATRTGEAIGARWSEIAGDVWIIPPERAKTRQQHRVPLSKQALAVLATFSAAEKVSGYVFPSDITDSEGRPFPISNMAMRMVLRRLKGKTQATVHGFRSSFRDWCADHGVPRELAEACLAHVAGGVERAYYRSDVIDLRRDLMQRWADHCLPPGGLGANVVPLVAAG